MFKNVNNKQVLEKLLKNQHLLVFSKWRIILRKHFFFKVYLATLFWTKTDVKQLSRLQYPFTTFYMKWSWVSYRFCFQKKIKEEDWYNGDARDKGKSEWSKSTCARIFGWRCDRHSWCSNRVVKSSATVGI